MTILLPESTFSHNYCRHYTPTSTDTTSTSAEIQVQRTTDTVEDYWNGDGMVKKRKHCPIHKLIRSQNWPAVIELAKRNPSLITEVNGVGWSSLILAIYHMAPTEVIAEMLDSLAIYDAGNDTENNANTAERLLSQTVPTGNRLCLHFATRFCSSLDVLQLLVDAYPRALLHKSDDGSTPLDRAVYYRKDKSILKWLESATKAEQSIYDLEEYNHQLRNMIWKACKVNHIYYRRHQRSPVNSETQFVLGLFSYTKEREMIGLFQTVISYVGVRRIPNSQQGRWQE